LKHLGALEPSVRVPVSGVGGLASKVTPSTLRVELPLMLDELRVPTVPVTLAAMPPKFMLHPFFRVCFGFGPGFLEIASGSSLDALKMAVRAATSYVALYSSIGNYAVAPADGPRPRQIAYPNGLAPSTPAQSGTAPAAAA
jgi:hypothetical protein